MASDLPYELHELICSYLDSSTLTTYSMTCHQFHSIAQKSIFSKVKLIFPRPTGISNSRTEGLLRLSASSPQICELVEAVSLVDRRHLPFNFMITYLWDDPILSSLLFRLQNVKNFSMESLALSSLAWISTSPTVQDALISVFHSNTLTSLALYRVVDLPLDVLDGCTALQDLSLELVTFPKQDMDAFFAISGTTKTQLERRARLKSLRLTLSDPLFHFFSTWITTPVCGLDVTNLQRFAASMTMEYYDHGNVNRILQACAKTLEVFCFSPTFQCKYVKHFSFYFLTRLPSESGCRTYSNQSYQHQHVALPVDPTHSRRCFSIIIKKTSRSGTPKLFPMDFQPHQPTPALEFRLRDINQSQFTQRARNGWCTWCC